MYKIQISPILISLTNKDIAFDLVTGFEAFSFEPTLVHFKGKPNGLLRAVGGFILCLHVCDVDDRAVWSQEGDRKWDQGVFHPKAVNPFGFEGEKHALVGGHGWPMHQAGLPLGG